MLNYSLRQILCRSRVPESVFHARLLLLGIPIARRCRSNLVLPCPRDHGPSLFTADLQEAEETRSGPTGWPHLEASVDWGAFVPGEEGFDCGDHRSSRTLSGQPTRASLKAARGGRQLGCQCHGEPLARQGVGGTDDSFQWSRIPWYPRR
jgi:hypothetical protein